jgi:hypothetical protein
MEQRQKMVRGTRLWNGMVLGLLGGGLALALWYASARYELPATPSTAAAPGGADTDTPGSERQEADAFAQLALETLRAAGIQGELHYDPERFLIQVPSAEGQQPLTLFLSNLHDEYRAAPPERRSEVLQRLLALHQAPKVPEAYAAVRPELLPVLRPRSYFELLGLAGTGQDGGPSGKAPVVWRPLGEVMALALVHDGPETMRYIDPEQLERWGVSFDTAHADALANLRRRSTEPLETLAPGTCASPWEDNYATSRLLLDEVVRRCPVRGEPVVLLPHRDLLLITGSKDEQGLVLIARRAEQALQAPRAQDGRALRLTPGGWVPFLPERGSPSWPAFHRLATISEARDYTEQAQQLQQLHEQQGVDIFVAGVLTAVDEDEDGPSRSQAVWVRGIDTLLPRVDVVFFMDSELGPEAPPVAVVPWDLVMRDVGHLLVPEPGLYPIRYRLKGFPSEKQFARWRKEPSVINVP